MDLNKTTCYIDDANVLGYEQGYAFVAFLRKDDGLRIAGSSSVELSEAECRKIAAWLNRVADGRKGA